MPTEDSFVQMLNIKYEKTVPKQETFNSGGGNSFSVPGRATYEVTLEFDNSDQADWLDNLYEIIISCDTEEQMHDPRFKEGEWYFFTQTPAEGDMYNQPQLRHVTMFEMLEIIVKRDIVD